MENIEKLVRDRRSVRTYDGKELSAQDLEKLRSFMENIENPYGIPVRFKLLDAKKDGLTCPVVSGTDLYVGGAIKRTANAEEAFGYSFEALVLFAQSLGIGTVWLGGTMDRAAYEKAMELSEDEMMPCASALGYPSKKMSLRESMMRMGIKADSRLPFETLFFDGSFDTPLTADKAGRLAQPLEMVRWAPSAVNKQPWRVIVTENAVHLYLKKRKALSSGSSFNIQKVDMGIALCHFDLAAKECDLNPVFSLNNPGFPTDEDVEHIASYQL